MVVVGTKLIVVPQKPKIILTDFVLLSSLSKHVRLSQWPKLITDEINLIHVFHSHCNLCMTIALHLSKWENDISLLKVIMQALASSLVTAFNHLDAESKIKLPLLF